MTSLSRARRGIAYLLVLILVGIGAGVGGILLTYLLHEVQHLTFGYSLHAIIGDQSFLYGVMHASPSRRFWGIIAAGFVAMIGGILFRKYSPSFKGVSQAMDHPEKPMPFVTTIASAILQITTVAMGSPLGRESAPREFGALVASQGLRYSHWLFGRQNSGLSSSDVTALIACGAGAGLAAVYNVPLAGALFTLEVLIKRVNVKLVLSALITSGTAAYIATLGLGHSLFYTFHDNSHIVPLTLICLIFSPVIGGAAYLFKQFSEWAKYCAKHCNHLPYFCMGGFLVVAVIALWLPQIPGNGRGILQTALNDYPSLNFCIALLVFKTLSVILVLRGDVKGGVITPSLAIGGVLGAILFHLIQNIAPIHGMPGYVVSSAAGFLAAEMNMPLTAILLAIELIHVPANFMIPIAVNGMAAYWVCRWLESRKIKHVYVHASQS